MSPTDHNHMLAYTHIPTSAFRIPEPDLSSPPPDPHDPRYTFSGDSSSTTKTAEGERFRSRLASFPPNSSGVPPSARKGNNLAAPGSKGDTSGGVGGIGSALSSGVTDMFISHLLPSTLPSKATQQAPLPVPGKVRSLSSQRESLSLPTMTNSFRRFVARCGTIFWVQDRVEEVLYWRKPVWTWSCMLLWGFICFYPRIILLIPFCTIILILLHQHTKTHPVIQPTPVQPVSSPTVSAPKTSLLNNALTNSIAATLTQNNDPSVNSKARADAEHHQHHHGSQGGKGEERGYSATATDANGREIPAASGAPPESGVDYYMNLQGIQNFMGLFSDIHDAVLPFISLIVPSMPNPQPLPTTFPLSPTHIMILCLPPAILLPLVPLRILSFLLLPIGILPPIVYHPAFLPALERARRWEGLDKRRIRYWRVVAERWVLTDRLDDSIARSEIREVRVWENQRLDPSWIGENEARLKAGADKDKDKRPRSGSGGKVLEEEHHAREPPDSAWSSVHLKNYERSGWVRALPTSKSKYQPDESLWQDEPGSDARRESGTGQANAGGRVALSLIKGWSFVPGEDWRVDWVAEWDRVGGDEAGWIYTDDEWKQPSPDSVVDVILPGKKEVETRYMVTRRRQWWRRVYSTE